MGGSEGGIETPTQFTHKWVAELFLCEGGKMMREVVVALPNSVVAL